jgi:hypothetical protein
MFASLAYIEGLVLAQGFIPAFPKLGAVELHLAFQGFPLRFGQRLKVIAGLGTAGIILLGAVWALNK